MFYDDDAKYHKMSHHVKASFTAVSEEITISKMRSSIKPGKMMNDVGSISDG